MGGNGSSQRLGLLALLLLVSAITFAPILRNSFTTWDDDETIWRNPDLNPPRMAGIARYWREPHMALYVPVTYTVWGALSAIAYDEASEYPATPGAKLNPLVFHAASVIVHLVCIALVFAILQELGMSAIA